MTMLHLVVLIYCTVVALFGGATHRLRVRTASLIAAAVVVGLVSLEFVFFGSPHPWLTLTKGSGLVLYFVPRLLFLSVLTAVAMALGRSVGPWVSRWSRGRS